jgi:hypothetical protein
VFLALELFPRAPNFQNLAARGAGFFMPAITTAMPSIQGHDAAVWAMLG